jgi:acetyl-CoA carboxylase biotin carboxyl carrier protein
MPEHRSDAVDPTVERSPEARTADHATIDRLADELLPSLVARLGASGLGELEVREGAWRVRLRRPPGADRRLPAGGRSAPGRGQKATSDGERGRDPGASPTGATSPSGAGFAPGPDTGSADDALPPLTSVGFEAGIPPVDHGPVVAASPAVGVFRERSETRPGTRVRAGDRLGTVDVLGVPVEVTAPVDSIVASALVEDGDAVEYGQPIVALEPLTAGGHGAGSGPGAGSGHGAGSDHAAGPAGSGG